MHYNKWNWTKYDFLASLQLFYSLPDNEDEEFSKFVSTINYYDQQHNQKLKFSLWRCVNARPHIKRMPESHSFASSVRCSYFCCRWLNAGSVYDLDFTIFNSYWIECAYTANTFQVNHPHSQQVNTHLNRKDNPHRSAHSKFYAIHCYGGPWL